MQVYKAPTEQYQKLLKVFDIHDKDYDEATLIAVMDNAAKFVEQELCKTNEEGDNEGCSLDQTTHKVTLPKSFHNAYQQYVEQGWAAVGGNKDYGGAQMPLVSVLAIAEFMSASNVAFSLGPMLTPAACQAIDFAGTKAQKDKYLAKLIAGTWSGTMCLTEAHCGTDLGLIKTKAVPKDDHYLITGNKIWITYGEHDLTDNIIHLVLAKLPDAPSGSKGISMFIVPKYLEDGTRNKLMCTGLEKKMGQHASPTCFMSFENAKGYLLGKPNAGLKNMFVMMNEARIGVGVSALALSERAYQTAISFVKDRRQSRSLNEKKQDLTKDADNILVHPDVRRQLLEVKSTNIAMRALVVYAAMLAQNKAASSQARLALLIPIIKSYVSDRGVLNIDTCIQVIGGSGYVKDWSLEQFFRDARISRIYEGTNGIQALDLVGRKLMKDNGVAIKELIEEMHEAAIEADDTFVTEGLRAVADDLKSMTFWLAKHALADHEQAGAVASDYLHLCALALLAFMWAKMIKSNQDFDRNIALYFYQRVLPARLMLTAVIKSGKSSMVDLDDKCFD